VAVLGGLSADLGVGAGAQTARDVGANVVYVKRVGSGVAVLYTGFTVMASNCLTLLADFIYADAPLIAKWQEEDKKAKTADGAKE
jgi:hypothetical protein